MVLIAARLPGLGQKYCDSAPFIIGHSTSRRGGPPACAKALPPSRADAAAAPPAAFSHWRRERRCGRCFIVSLRRWPLAAARQMLWHQMA